MAVVGNIIPRLTVGGTNFATIGANGITAFTGYVGSGADLNANLDLHRPGPGGDLDPQQCLGYRHQHRLLPVLGEMVYGTNIATGTFITAINSATSLTLSANSTILATGASTIAFAPDTANTLIADGTNTNTLFNNNVTAINGLKFSGNGLTVGSADSQFQLLTITSGGVLVTGGSDTLSAPRIQFAAATTEGIIQVNTGATLNLSGVITNFQTGGLTKGLGGNLNISSAQYYTGATTLNGGITTLVSGGTNTLFFNNTLTVNEGATLDLNAGVQYAGNFTSGNGALPGAGGTVQSTGGTGTLLTNGASGIWAGTITGGVNFVKMGNTTLTADSANPYNGVTVIMGGTLTLRDSATLANTSGITINYGTLTLDNESDLGTDNTNRVNDSANITMNGGTRHLRRPPQQQQQRNLGRGDGPAQGANTITVGINITGNLCHGGPDLQRA